MLLLYEGKIIATPRNQKEAERIVRKRGLGSALLVSEKGRLIR